MGRIATIARLHLSHDNYYRGAHEPYAARHDVIAFLETPAPRQIRRRMCNGARVILQSHTHAHRRMTTIHIVLSIRAITAQYVGLTRQCGESGLPRGRGKLRARVVSFHTMI